MKAVDFTLKYSLINFLLSILHNRIWYIAPEMLCAPCHVIVISLSFMFLLFNMEELTDLKI